MTKNNDSIILLIFGLHCVDITGVNAVLLKN